MKRALVVLHRGFEEIEAVTVIDVLRRAGIDVIVCSTSPCASVVGSHGLELCVSQSLGDESVMGNGEFDAIALPGGMKGVEGLLACDELRELICAQSARGGILAAVCAAPLVLARAGVLEGRDVTCHPCVRSDGARSRRGALRRRWYDRDRAVGGLLVAVGIGISWRPFGCDSSIAPRWLV